MAHGEFVDVNLTDPWNMVTHSWSDLFESVLGSGSGMVFLLVPVIVLTIGLWVKTQNGVICSMFMISCGVLFSAGGVFTGSLGVLPVFIIFTAIGFVGLFMSMLFQK